jgi:hypothetical protein
MDGHTSENRQEKYMYKQKKLFQKITQEMIMSNTVFFFRKKRHLVALLFCLIVSTIYFYCAEFIMKNVFVPTNNDYYTYLLDAFFHGRTNITPPPSQIDLSLFENKWYLYWGPAPVLLILPFYLISHLQASDILYTAIGGTINVALFYGVMQAFKKYFHLSLSFTTEVFLLLSFGLASPNFNLSIAGQVWSTEQVFATTYLLLFYLLYFRFLKSEKHWQLILCTVFFCLACLSRYTLVLHGILFIYAFLQSKRSGRTIPTKIILSLALIMLAFVSLEALYNFVRFHNVLETGIRFVEGGPRFDVVMKKNEVLSPRYILHNVYYCFFNLIHFSTTGIPVVDPDGNSIFSFYPALLLVPVLLCKIKNVGKKGMLFLIIAGIVIGLNLSLLMLYVSTGWPQSGYRYILDVLPLLFLLLMFILPSIPMLIQMGLLAYGIFVNLYGTMLIRSLFGFLAVPPLEETFFWIVLLTSLLPFLSIIRLEVTEQG